MVKQERATITMPEDLKLRARAKAILEGKNLSQVIREFLVAWVDGKVELPSQEPEQGEPEG